MGDFLRAGSNVLLLEELLALSRETCSWASGVGDSFVLNGGEDRVRDNPKCGGFKRCLYVFDYSSIGGGVFVSFLWDLGKLITTLISREWQK